MKKSEKKFSKEQEFKKRKMNKKRSYKKMRRMMNRGMNRNKTDLYSIIMIAHVSSTIEPIGGQDLFGGGSAPVIVAEHEVQQLT